MFFSPGEYVATVCVAMALGAALQTLISNKGVAFGLSVQIGGESEEEGNDDTPCPG